MGEKLKRTNIVYEEDCFPLLYELIPDSKISPNAVALTKELMNLENFPQKQHSYGKLCYLCITIT